jgi:hypothetical protein
VRRQWFWPTSLASWQRETTPEAIGAFLAHSFRSLTETGRSASAPMALTTAEVTAVSRNSGTRRIREDTQGHDQGADQVRGDTVGPAGILKDTSLRRFGTVRPRVQIPGPRPFLYSKSAISDVVWSQRITAGSQFPGELSQPRRASVTVVGGSELAWQQSMACGRFTLRTQRAGP